MPDIGDVPFMMPTEVCQSSPRRSIMGRSLLGAMVWAAALAPAFAAGAPFSKPVRFIIPYPAGGPTDLTGRVFAERISKHIGQPVIVENKPGAQGVIAVQQFLQAPADGHAIYFGTLSTQVVFPVLSAQRKQPLPFDAQKDFVAVASMTTSPLVVVASTKASIRSYKELIDALKTGAGRLGYGSDGIGSLTHLGGALIGQAAGVQSAVHVPYKGTAEYSQALLRGDVQFGVMGSIGAMTLVKQDGVRVLAVAQGQRSRQWPGVPTTAESGYPGVDLASWFGIFMKAGTPKQNVDAMAESVRLAAQDPDLVRQLTQAGLDVDVCDSAGKFSVRVDADLIRWRTVVKRTDLELNELFR
jgi:tripartite-type tricarboxylate transporter receptor subunit TctC